MNGRTSRTEKHTNNNLQKVPDLKFIIPDVRFVHTRLTSDAQMKKVRKSTKLKVQRGPKVPKRCDQCGQGFLQGLRTADFFRT